MKSLSQYAYGVFMVLVMGISTSAWSEEMQTPDALVKETSQKVLALLEARKEQIKSDPGEVFKLVDEVVLPHFDFVLMSRLVLGKHWRDANNEQKQSFVLAFKELLVRTYATSLRQYSGQAMNFLPFSQSPDDKKAKVRTEVVGADGKSVGIDYGLRKTSDGWKVYDVIVEGLSLVTNYRSSFDSDINSIGLDALISKIQSENAVQSGANKDGA